MHQRPSSQPRIIAVCFPSHFAHFLPLSALCISASFEILEDFPPPTHAHKNNKLFSSRGVGKIQLNSFRELRSLRETTNCCKGDFVDDDKDDKTTMIEFRYCELLLSVTFYNHSVDTFLLRLCWCLATNTISRTPVAAAAREQHFRCAKFRHDSSRTVALLISTLILERERP